MPRGVYQRPSTRGSYNKQNGRMVKRAIYLTNELYDFLKTEANKRQMSYSELLRQILENEFIELNKKDIDNS